MDNEIINRFGGIEKIPKYCTFCEYRHNCYTEKGPKLLPNKENVFPIFKRYSDCPDFVLGKCITCSMAGFNRPECDSHQAIFDYQKENK